MGRNYLAGRAGDAVNALMAAVGYNFRRLAAWFAALLCALLAIRLTDVAEPSANHVYAA
jgi:IS5 family transposase